MQLRSANFATAQVASKCNPIIIAFDRNWRELYRAPLNLIDGMDGLASGVGFFATCTMLVGAR